MFGKASTLLLPGTLPLDHFWAQALSDDAYAYDHKRYLNWDEYNPEQQAQMVEDWYADGMKKSREEDIRFYYIIKYIWRENVDVDWIADQYAIKPLPAGTLKVFIVDDVLLPILRLRFRADDMRGQANRAKQLEEISANTTGSTSGIYCPASNTGKAGIRCRNIFRTTSQEVCGKNY